MNDVPKKANDASHIANLVNFQYDESHHGELLCQTSINLYSSSHFKLLHKKHAERHLFLFATTVLITKKEEDVDDKTVQGSVKGQVRYLIKDTIPTSNLKFMINDDSRKITLTNNFNGDKWTLSCVDHSVLVKNLNSIIDDSFNKG